MTGRLRDMVAYLRTDKFMMYFRGLRIAKVEPNRETINKIKEYARKIQKNGVGRCSADKGASE